MEILTIENAHYTPDRVNPSVYVESSQNAGHASSIKFFTIINLSSEGTLA